MAIEQTSEGVWKGMLGNRKGDEGTKVQTANDEAECGTASHWLQYCRAV